MKSIPIEEMSKERLKAELINTMNLGDLLDLDRKAKDAKIKELEAERNKYYWHWQAAKCFCQNCGEMRTDTETNDGECYSCGASGMYTFEPKESEAKDE